jgi:hypothetical protein
VRFKLKDQHQSFSLQCPPDELKSILELLVSSHGMVTEKTLNRLHEGDSMSRKFVGLEVILEIPRLKSMPVDHSSPSFGVFLRVHCRPRKTPRKQQSVIQFDAWQLSQRQYDNSGKH